MADMMNGSNSLAQAGVVDPAALALAPAKRENAGPAGGLLIAVGCSLILWAILVQLARMASWVLF